ncbi:hypothetical protein M3Y95_00442200 [Aphelenchoides besseyi]|nr:hypothetical protein M3Y95_00442200 [Aphelenchoides besseyi]
MSSGVTKADGCGRLIRYYENGTHEVRHLLDKECDVIYECKYCREMFRSIVTFVSHKRTSCRSMYGDLTEELELAKKFQSDLRRQREERGETNGPVKSGRTNLESILDERTRKATVTLPHSKKPMDVLTLPKSRRSTPLTEFADGYQRLVEMPTELAISAQVPDDRVVVVMPQEKSSRYGEMQLRNRRVDGRAATLTNEQLRVLQKLPDDIVHFTELSSLTCQHAPCKQIRPFDTFEALIYHMTLTHHSDTETTNRCYFCDTRGFATYEKLKTHMKDRHASIRKNHIEARRSSTRKNYRKKNERLHRSISPVAFIEESESAESGSDGEPMAVDESVGPEDELKNDDSNSAISVVKRIVTRRGKRQKGKKSALRPILSPQKVRPVQPETHGPVEMDISNAVEYDMADIDQFLNIQSNDSTLAALSASQAENSTTFTPAPTVKSPLKRTRAQSKMSAGSMSDEEGEKEKIIKEEVQSENTSDEEFEGTSEKKARKEADVTLIRGREPRQRAVNSRLSKDFVVPKRFAGDSSFLCETEYRDSTKQRKKKTEQPQKRKIPRREGKINDPKADESESRKGKIDSNKKNSKPLKVESRASTPSVEEEMNDYELAKLVVDKVTHSMMRSDSSGAASKDTSPDPNDEWTSSTIPNSETNGSQNNEKSTRKKSGFPLATDDPDAASSTATVGNKTTGHENDVVQPVTQKTRGEAASRRKQNFTDSMQTEDSTSEVKLVQLPGKKPCKPDNLTEVPVTLTGSERRSIFGPLKAMYNTAKEKDGLYQCGECGKMCFNQAEGNKHMVGHVRAIRMQCSLCDAGAFFCTDLRKHLMFRHCEKLHLAPPELIESRTPCMDEKTADKLIKLADPNKPGCAVYIPGKIVSAESAVPYIPNPVIENRLLSTMRSAAASRGPPRKLILSKKSTVKSTRSSSQQCAETTESCARTQSSQSQPKETTPLSNGSSSKESSPPATTNAILNEIEVKSSINETTRTGESKANSAAESSEKSTASQAVVSSHEFDMPCTINIAPPQLKAQPVKQEITPIPEVVPQPQVPISEPVEKHSDESSHKIQTFSHRSPVKPSILSSRSSSKPATTTSESMSSVPTLKTNRSATGSPNLFSSHQQANGAEQLRLYHEMYPSSTQKRHWTFTNRDEIRALRQKANDEYRHKIQLNGSDPEIEASLLNVDDEELFLKIVTEPGIRFGETFRPSMWPSVRWIAFAYFKRFYLRYAPMEYSPKVIIQACYYLATKIDEFNVSIDEFVANLQKGSAKENAEQILKWEPIIIHRLDYQLTIHCPFRPFEGHVMELKNHGMLGFDLEAIRPYANEFFRKCLYGDSMLIYAPTHIALAALSYGLDKLGKISDIFREHIFRLCQVDTWKPSAENLTLADKLMLRVEEIRQLVEEQSVGVTPAQKTELQKKMERFSGIPDRVKPSNQQDDQGPVDSDDE